MNPKPLSELNHLTVPCATRISPCLQWGTAPRGSPAVNPRARHEARTQKLQTRVYSHLGPDHLLLPETLLRPPPWRLASAIDHLTTRSGAFTTFPRKRLTVSNYQKSTIAHEIGTMREKSDPGPLHCPPGDRGRARSRYGARPGARVLAISAAPAGLGGPVQPD